MKTLLLILLPFIAQAQLSSELVYKTLEKKSQSTEQIKKEARITAEVTLMSLNITGDYSVPESDYDVSVYTG